MAICAPSFLFLETQTSLKPVNKIGSSPTSSAVCFGDTMTGPMCEPPYPRLTTIGFFPISNNRITKSITTGVLPVPPILMFPTQITGMPIF